MDQNEGWYMDELGQWQKDPYYQPPQGDQGQYGNQQVGFDSRIVGLLAEKRAFQALESANYFVPREAFSFCVFN